MGPSDRALWVPLRIWPQLRPAAICAFRGGGDRGGGILVLRRAPIWEALGLSVANTLNVFGFRKDFFDSDFIRWQPTVLKILAAAQTIVGGALLFLFGLGIRNKFRMK